MKFYLVIVLVLSSFGLSAIADEKLNCSQAKLTCNGKLASGYGPQFLIGDFSMAVNVSIEKGTLNGIAHESALKLTVEGKPDGSAAFSCPVAGAGPFFCKNGVVFRGDEFLAYASSAIFRGSSGDETFGGWLYLKYEELPSYEMKTVEPIGLTCKVTDCKE